MRKRKKAISLLLVVAMVTTFFTNLPLTQAIAADTMVTRDYIFQDTYETLPLGNLSSAPAQYNFDQNSGTREVVADPENPNNKVLKYAKQPGGSHKTNRWFGAQMSGVSTVEGKYRFDSFDTEWGFEIRMSPYTSEDEMAVVKKEENEDYGYLYVGGTKTQQKLYKEVWYTISCVIDQDAYTYNLYVDEVFVAQGTFPESYIGKSFDAFNVKNYTESGTSSIYIDDLTAYRGQPGPVPTATPLPQHTPSADTPPFFMDAYDDLTLGTLSSLSNYYFEYNGGTREVVTDPYDSANKVLKFTKSYAPTGHKTIRWYGNNPTGIFTTQMRVMFSDVTNYWGFTIRMSPYTEMEVFNLYGNAGGYADMYVHGANVSQAIHSCTWYTFSVVMDKNENQYSVYVNGVPVSMDNPLPSDFTERNFDAFQFNNFTNEGSSSIYLDDFTAYAGWPNVDAIIDTPTPETPTPETPTPETPTPETPTPETPTPETPDPGTDLNPNDPWWERMFNSEARTYYSETLGTTMSYRLFKPYNYVEGTEENYPLMVSLGGQGYENGTDNIKQLERTNFAEPLTNSENATKYPAFILVPQCPVGATWYTEYENNLQLQTVTEIVTSLKEEFESIDQNRIYLGGMSSGANGILELLAHQPDLFAAAVPISGNAENYSLLPNLVDKAIWSFWCTDDIVLGSPKRNRDFMEALTAIGGHPIYTEYLLGVHAIWDDKVFVSPVFEWLFLQQNGGIVSNEYIDNVITEYNNSVKSANDDLDKIIGDTSISLDGERAYIRTQGTPYGNLVTDALKYYTGADIALQQGGGFGGSLSKGEITALDVSRSLPYDNNVVVMNVTGADLLAALENGFSAYPDLDGRFPQVSGMTIVFDPQGVPFERIQSVEINGEPLNPEQTYRLATNDYIAQGGDGYEMLQKYEASSSYGFIRNVVSKYIIENGIQAASISNQRIVNVGLQTPNAPIDSVPLLGTMEAENFIASEGIEVVSEDALTYISSLDRNDWMDYAVSVSNAGDYSVKLRVASSVDNGRIQIRDAFGNLLNTCNVPNTEGSWVIVTMPITLEQGVQTIRVSVGAGGFLLDSIQFQTRTNVALHKTATADNDFGAQNAVDDHLQTKWKANDASANHWWQVDLGAQYDLTGINIYWEMSYVYGPIYQYVVEYSDDGENWFTAVDRSNNQNGRQNIYDAFAVSARYIRIKTTNTFQGNAMSFYDVQVYGALTEG